MSTLYRASCDCGFTASHARRAYAERALRIHSCEKWVARIAGQQRRSERMAAVDRTPKPCLHKIANHVHGTYACYVLDRCKCLPCTKANSSYETERTRQQAYGRWDNYIDAQPARDHVRALMDAGMGLKRIVAVSDASQGQLWKLLYGKKKPDGTRTPSKRIRKDVAERLLAIRVDLADGAVIDSTGTTRRIRALVALGWSQSKLAARLGMERSEFVLAQGNRDVTVRTAKAVIALYDELSMTLPPAIDPRHQGAATRARTYAAARGWLPPLALDDDRLDDPTYKPESLAVETDDQDLEDEHLVDLDEAAIYRRTHGDKTVRLTVAEATELVARWAAAGRSLSECQRITGIKPDRYFRLKDQGVAS